MEDALGPDAPPHWEGTEKGHGRIEERALWMVPCPAAMQQYLAQEWGWPGAQWGGYIRRRRWPLPMARWEEESLHVWIAGAAFPWSLDGEEAAGLLRAHWHIENRVFLCPGWEHE